LTHPPPDPLPRQALSSLLPNPTLGLVVTLTTVACIIAADTGAYFVGKTLGRTKLTDISPKKTVEGALGGLASSVATALVLQSVTGWPGPALAAAGYGVLTFVSSIFGDLIESIIKRDAGMKVRGLMGCVGARGLDGVGCGKQPNLPPPPRNPTNTSHTQKTGLWQPHPRPRRPAGSV
jgi:phosphatidate cytidylyltransferase